MTYEDIKKANEVINAITFKDKPYAPVNERIKAFREICPGGSIITEIISLEDGVATMKATVTDNDGAVLATGLAQEKESNGYVNKTSFIENCETSAVGRALGFAGIGVDGSICSADELVTALKNQDDSRPKPQKKTSDKIDAERVIKLKKYLKAEGKQESVITDYFKIEKVEDMTEAHWTQWCTDHDKIMGINS